MLEIICDFCSSPVVAWRYPAETFSIDIVTSYEDWAACDLCHALIEAGDSDGLLNRSVAMFPGLADVPADAREGIMARLHAMITPLHNGFHASRQGPAAPHLGR